MNIFGKSINIEGKNFPIKTKESMYGKKIEYIIFGTKEVYLIDPDRTWFVDKMKGYLPGATIEELERAFELDSDAPPKNFLIEKFNLPSEAGGWMNSTERVAAIWKHGAEAYKPETLNVLIEPVKWFVCEFGMFTQPDQGRCFVLLFGQREIKPVLVGERFEYEKAYYIIGGNKVTKIV